MASSSAVIILEDSDTDDLEVSYSATGSDPIFCQICGISLSEEAASSRQAHYEQHFGVDEDSIIIECTLTSTLLNGLFE